MLKLYFVFFSTYNFCNIFSRAGGWEEKRISATTFGHLQDLRDHITGALVARAEAAQCDLPDLPLSDMQAEHKDITEDVYSVLSVENSVASRTSFGGTSPVRVREQIARWRSVLG